MNNLTVQSTSVLDIINNNSKLASSTKAQYCKAINNAVNAGVDIADSEQLAKYANGLNKSSRSFLKAAIRLWSKGIELQAKAGATPDNVSAIQATVYRLESLNNAIEVEASSGSKLHNWLSKVEVKKLLNTCDDTLKGQRDRVVLSVLLGAGLRRDELAQLEFSDIVMRPFGDKMRTVINIRKEVAKRDKERQIPISDSLAALLDKWQAMVGGGRVARSISQVGDIGNSLSGVAIFKVVRSHGAMIDKSDLAAHDLRRTYAQIGYESGVGITQISVLLGHSSVAVTQKYLQLDLDLNVTVSDFVPI